MSPPPLVICNLSAECPIEPCAHKRPHQADHCAPPGPCEDYPDDVSACVEVLPDHTFKRYRGRVQTCPTCGHSARKDEWETVNIKAEPSDD